MKQRHQLLAVIVFITAAVLIHWAAVLNEPELEMAVVVGGALALAWILGGEEP